MAFNSKDISEGKTQTRLDLPGLPAAPRYPCPFVTAKDMETYILPLYRIGWGISCAPGNASSEKRIPSATQLSKKIILPNRDITRSFVKDIMYIIEQENHHPALDQQGQGALSAVDIHIHTHTALAPPVHQNVDDQKIIRRRPGITLRDIRFAILVERLLLDYTDDRSFDAPSSLFFLQPTDIDSLHNARALVSQLQDSVEK